MISFLETALTGRWGGVVTGGVFFVLSCLFAVGLNWHAARQDRVRAKHPTDRGQHNNANSHINGNGNTVDIRQSNWHQDNRVYVQPPQGGGDSDAVWGYLLVAMVAGIAVCVGAALVGAQPLRLIGGAAIGSTVGILVIVAWLSRQRGPKLTAGFAVLGAALLYASSMLLDDARIDGQSLADVRQALPGGGLITKWSAMTDAGRWLSGDAAAVLLAAVLAATIIVFVALRALAMTLHESHTPTGLTHRLSPAAKSRAAIVAMLCVTVLTLTLASGTPAMWLRDHAQTQVNANR